MIKDLKKTGLFSLLVGLVLIFVIFEIKKFKEEEDVKEIKEKVVKLEAGKIIEIIFGEYQFEKKFTGWRSIKAPLIDTLDADKVTDFINEVLKLNGRVLSDPGETVNWPEFGFVKSSKSLVFSSKSKKTTVILSNNKSFDGSSYLKVSGQKNSEVLVSSGPEWFDIFNQNALNLRDPKVFNWPVTKSIKDKSPGIQITFSKRDKSYTLNLDKTWSTKESKYKKWIFDDAKINSLLEDIKNFRAKSFLDELPRNNVEYGEVLVVVSPDKRYSLKVYKHLKTYYASNSSRPNIYFDLGSDNIDTFFPDIRDLRSLSGILSFNQDNIQSFLFKYKGKDENFEKLKDGEWISSGLKNDGDKEVKRVNGGAVSKLFSLMSNSKVERVLEKPNTLPKPVLIVSYKTLDQKRENFEIYSTDLSCVRVETSGAKKECYILYSKGSYYAFKKELSKEIFKLKFFSKVENIKKDIGEADSVFLNKTTSSSLSEPETKEN